MQNTKDKHLNIFAGSKEIFQYMKYIIFMKEKHNIEIVKVYKINLKISCSSNRNLLKTFCGI